MKTRKFIIATVWIAAATLIWSCSDSEVTPDGPQENLFAANILSNSGAATSRARGIGFGGPIGAIYGSFSAGSGGRTAGSPLSMTRGTTAGRVATDSTGQTPDCLVETWEEDENGNYTYTLDFGDGCDYYGEFMKGKLVETGNYTGNSFSSSSTYTDFGGEDWSIDGTYNYSGTWEDTSETDPTNPDDSVWMYNATYSFEADLTEKYTVYDSTSNEEEVLTVDYESSGSEKMDQDSYTVESRSESVSVSSGESYTSQVDTPLHMDYNCEDVWIFVSGVESGTYTYEGQSGSYSIDYGDGTCDNIISLTENGETEEIDLGEAWDEWEDECGNDHN